MNRIADLHQRNNYYFSSFFVFFFVAPVEAMAGELTARSTIFYDV